MVEVLEKEKEIQGVARRQVDKFRPMKIDEPVREEFKSGFNQNVTGTGTSQQIKNTVIRRSKFIIQAKRVLVIAGVLIISAIIIYPFFRNGNEGMRFSLTGEQTIEKKGQEIVQHIKKPKLYGIDKLNQRFNLSAEEAVQNGVNSTTMNKLTGDIYLKDGGWVNILADTGDYDTSTKMLKMNGNVQIYSDNGYELHADRAEVNLDTSEAVGYDNVHFQGALGVIDSNIINIKKGGDVIQFSGGVHMTAFPEATAVEQ
jgi:lipopolysaccharide export system protein LptC